MILEMAVLPVRPGQEAAFEAAEAALRRARPLIAETPGFHSLTLSRGIESPSHYMLLVEWDSVEAHEVGFRRSENDEQWRERLHHFYDPLPTVEHYTPVVGV
jgi:heme-degrading monooxygenase HmoA